ncbi:MAG: hypothetical protein JXB49_32640 [Bacteroidales bacterium]|nr:hypothetical protein [Bacteroidales bacterium]
MTQNIGRQTAEPTFVIVIDTSQIIVDYRTVERINKKWIKEIRVLKDSESQKIYGHQNGVILVFIKNRYNNKLLSLIADQK